MLLFKLAKNNNKAIAKSYGKYYAHPVVTQTYGLTELAQHMSSHNTPFSPGAVKGILTDMVVCIKELVMQNIAVKIDDLAIFSIGIRPKLGANTEKEFSVANNINGLRLRARATGKLSNGKLDLEKQLKNAANLLGDDSDDTDKGSTKGDTDKGGTTTPSQGGNTDTGGSTPSKDDSSSDSKGDNTGGDDSGDIKY